MQRFSTTASSAWPLFSAAAIREHEASRPAPEQARQWGRSLARLSSALAPHARNLWIIFGQGLQGLAGLQAAVQLLTMQAASPGGQRRILLSSPLDLPALTGPMQTLTRQAMNAGALWTEGIPGLSAQDLCLDALLGTTSIEEAGNRPRLQVLLQQIQACPAITLSAGLASGLNPDSGQHYLGLEPPHGASHTRGPRHTLALPLACPALFTGKGRDACGQIWRDDDLPESPQAGPHLQPCAQIYRPQAAAEALQRPHASHKGSFGDVLVLGGQGMQPHGSSMAGAAWLAALAALHSGAGRVLLALLDEQASAGISPWPEIMLRRPQAQDFSQATVVCGCGGGQAIRGWMPQVLEQAPRLVLDADGLNAVAADHSLAQALSQRRQRGLASVLTPHPLEAARLLGCDTAQIQARRLDSASRLAQRFACTVLLKGSGTVIAHPLGDDQEAIACWINPTGNARLATGGTGDVLAGLIASLWGQGLAPEQAAALGAYRHGAAADCWPPGPGFSASALARSLSPA
ncbi:NAD(P)H-hydrate dehydratase [Comamonas composti]|uniref:NAD(P)H-hydrate dehydratase n=1 Tax=Comamonas composti TaxID=408558 RepID=UPI00047D4B03|nr:NAD(P)H-hydrate dehydratase [Comamonas composti]